MWCIWRKKCKVLWRVWEDKLRFERAFFSFFFFLFLDKLQGGSLSQSYLSLLIIVILEFLCDVQLVNYMCTYQKIGKLGKLLKLCAFTTDFQSDIFRAVPKWNNWQTKQKSEYISFFDRYDDTWKLWYPLHNDCSLPSGQDTNVFLVCINKIQTKALIRRQDILSVKLKCNPPGEHI